MLESRLKKVGGASKVLSRTVYPIWTLKSTQKIICRFMSIFMVLTNDSFFEQTCDFWMELWDLATLSNSILHCRLKENNDQKPEHMFGSDGMSLPTTGIQTEALLYYPFECRFFETACNITKTLGKGKCGRKIHLYIEGLASLHKLLQRCHKTNNSATNWVSRPFWNIINFMATDDLSCHDRSSSDLRTISSCPECSIETSVLMRFLLMCLWRRETSHCVF